MKKNDEQLQEIEKDIKKYAKIAEIGTTEGGEQLIQRLGIDIVGAIDILTAKYKTLTHIELIAIISKLDVIIDIYRDLTRAEKNKVKEKKKYQERLKELIENY